MARSERLRPRGRRGEGVGKTARFIARLNAVRPRAVGNSCKRATAAQRSCAARKQTTAPPSKGGLAGSCGSSRPRSIVPDGRPAAAAASRDSNPAGTNRPSTAATEEFCTDSRRGTNTVQLGIADGTRQPATRPLPTPWTPDQRQERSTPAPRNAARSGSHEAETSVREGSWAGRNTARMAPVASGNGKWVHCNHRRCRRRPCNETDATRRIWTAQTAHASTCRCGGAYEELILPERKRRRANLRATPRPLRLLPARAQRQASRD
jgi:hypothetical protein